MKLKSALPVSPKRVYKVWYDTESGKLAEAELEFTYENGYASVEVGKVDLHAMVVFDV